MVDQRNLDTMYMEMAYAAAKRSYARRRKVGAILVTPDEGRFEGINGMPSKFDNNCENEEYRIDGNHDNYSESEEWVLRFCTPQPDGTWLTPRHNVVRKHLVTKLEVLHAESNAIMKVARSHASSIGGTIYCTLSPCLECAKLIIQAGITRVVYAEQYPYPGHSGPVRAVGLDLLQEAGIQVDNLPLDGHNVMDDELDLQDEGYVEHDEAPWTGYDHP